MHAPTLLIAVGLLGLGSCAGSSARKKVVQTAAFEHNCAVERVRIVQENSDIYAYVLDVCGTERRYRDMGNEKEFQFVEVTARPAGPPHPTPAPARSPSADSAPTAPASAPTPRTGE